MRILVLGAYGQVGLQLIRALPERVSMKNVFCSDIRDPPQHLDIQNHINSDACNAQALEQIINKHRITQIYCLPALLSATGEANPLVTERINMGVLFNTLEAARKLGLDKVFWPSSIAAFGEDTPKTTPQETVMNPLSAYGITKKAGELWCQYYAKKFKVDVRSVRYPGLIGYRSLPGGGTTDYAVDVFHKALKKQKYQCFLDSDTYLPMLYTDDAIRATLQLMWAPYESVKIRTSYNIGGMTFCPKQLFDQIRKHVPDLQIQYKIDPLRQKMANSWPFHIIDDQARDHWGWKHEYDLAKTCKVILDNLEPV